MTKDLLAFSADGPWQSWQMAEDLWHPRQMVQGFLAWSRISWQMAKNLSVFLPDCLEFLGKVGQEFVSILSRWSRFCQEMARDFLALIWADCLAQLLGKA